MLKRYKIPDCPVEAILMLVGDHWRIWIIGDLLTGTKRFGELKKSLKTISQKTLTEHLRFMEEYGLISRKIYAEVPPKVEYSLTKLGKSLIPIYDAMRKWGDSFKNGEFQEDN